MERQVKKGERNTGKEWGDKNKRREGKKRRVKR